ncbi:MAG: IclR family transcriptional regulator [Elusimicrobiota bacterium]
MKPVEQENSFKYPVHSVKFAFSLIEILARGKMKYSITELMKESQLPKGKIYRLLGTLKSLGYVSHHQESRKYYLTYKFSKISIALNERIHIHEIIPHMKRLAQRYKEMVNLAVLDQGQVVYLHSIKSPHALKLDFKVGTYQPAYCTALGRILLAYQDEATLSNLLKKDRLKAHTSKTVTDSAELVWIFQRIREQGYSYVNEEYRPGVCCIAVPVFDEKGKIAASLSFSVPTARMNQNILNRMVKSLKDTVGKIKLPQII